MTIRRRSVIRTVVRSGAKKEKEIEQEEQQQEQQQEEQQEEKEGQHVVVENNPIHFYMDNFGVINPFMAEEIDQWVQDLNTELVVKAMQITLENNKRSWSYVKGILKDWHSKNFTTVKDVEAAQAEFRRLQQCKTNRFRICTERSGTRLVTSARRKGCSAIISGYGRREKKISTSTCSI